MTSPAIQSPNGVTVLRDDYVVVNHLGTPFLTTPDRNLAIAYVHEKKTTFPGLQVDHVYVTETRRRAFRPRPQLVAS